MKRSRLLRLCVVWSVTLLLLGCRTIHHAQSETSLSQAIATSDTNKALHIVDSVRLVDSVRVEYKKGKTDTLVIERWKDRERTRIVRDTFRIERVDTLKVYYEKAVSKKSGSIPWWINASFFFFGGFLVVILFYKDYQQHRQGGGNTP